MLLDRGITGCPRVSYSLVDVRDVAAAHVKALELDNVAGESLRDSQLERPNHTPPPQKKKKGKVDIFPEIL